jgi:hypothetical protein
MTEQLKPCPFCGGKAGIVTECGVVECVVCNSYSCSVENWNTRAEGWIHIDVKPELHQAVLCKTEYADGTNAALIRHWNGKSGFLGEG